MSEVSELLPIIRSVGGDPADVPFWEACSEGRFLVHRCTICDRSYWPASRCIAHGDQAMAWSDASGRGEVYTYTILHHAFTPAMKGRTPYVVAVVRLEEGPFFHTNILDCPPEAVAVGMPVEVVMPPSAEAIMLPMFRPIGSDAS